MNNTVRFDEEVVKLIAEERFAEAEKKLQEAHAEARKSNDHQGLENVLSSLAQLCVLKRDYEAAEKHYNEWENLFPGSITAKLEYANLCLYCLGNPQKVIERLNGMRLETEDEVDLISYFIGLNLRGVALVALGKLKEARDVLEEMVTLLSKHAGVEFPAELSLVEQLIRNRVALPLCKRYLTSVERLKPPRDYNTALAELMRKVEKNLREN